ncbi:MAG: retropepsin-like aspartic protease family protein [Bacteroidales bacterium]
MRIQVQLLLFFTFCFFSDSYAQTIYYDAVGKKTDRLNAKCYRIYKLDKTNKRGIFNEFDMQNKLLSKSGFVAFDLSDKKNEIIDGTYIEYKNDTTFKIEYINNIPINQVDVYDAKNRIIEIIPVKNGEITYDSDVIHYYYFEKSTKNEYYTVKGKFEGDDFYGNVTFFYENITQTYFLNGENYYSVLQKQNNGICDAFNYFNYKDKFSDDVTRFKDNFNCGKNNNWVMFYAAKELNTDFEFANIKNNQLYLEVTENEIATSFRLLNPTPFVFKNNDFDVKVDILSQNKCISGITINNINYLTNEYTNQYRIGLSNDLGLLLIEKMIDGIYIVEKQIEVSDLVRNTNELRLLKEENTLKVILNNTLVYSDINYNYVGESLGLYCFGNKGRYSYFDDFELKIKVKDSSVIAIKMKKDGNIYKIPISLNDIILTDFIFDTGASDVSITPDLALLLINSGTISSEDWLEDKYYQFANGSVAKSKTFKIKKLKIGDKYLFNVECSISNNLEAPLLIGQNVLNRFGKVTIDNERKMLYLE